MEVFWTVFVRIKQSRIGLRLLCFVATQLWRRILGQRIKKCQHCIFENSELLKMIIFISTVQCSRCIFQIYIARNKHTLITHYLLYLLQYGATLLQTCIIMQFSILLLMLNCGPICGGQRVGAQFRLCGFSLTYRTWVCQHFVLDLFLFFLSVLAREHASNERIKEVVLRFLLRLS